MNTRNAPLSGKAMLPSAEDINLPEETEAYPYAQSFDHSPPPGLLRKCEAIYRSEMAFSSSTFGTRPSIQQP
jgi:hypothetical protein